MKIGLRLTFIFYIYIILIGGAATQLVPIKPTLDAISAKQGGTAWSWVFGMNPAAGDRTPDPPVSAQLSRFDVILVIMIVNLQSKVEV